MNEEFLKTKFPTLYKIYTSPKLWQFYNKLLECKKHFSYFKFFTFPLNKKVFILATPLHSNVGDIAIALAQYKFLKNAFPSCCIKEVSHKECEYLSKKYIKPFVKNNYLFTVGGGNIGDEWFYEEEIRRKIISTFSKQNICVFPQTIFYTNTSFGEQEKNNSIPLYNNSRLKLVAREKTSKSIMDSLYPNAKTLLTPDIVLYTTPKDYGVEKMERSGILWCMRSDAEKSLSKDFENELFAYIEKFNLSIKKTDMHCKGDITKENRFVKVKEKMEEFSSSKIVITDRLHSMIFATLTATPCIVFGNYNHKVSGTYEWISYLPYIRYVNTMEDAKKNFEELLNLCEQNFDNTPLIPYFEKLNEFIKE